MTLSQHPFEPVYDTRSRILILGSFPSVRSRQQGFYYGNARNRFWPVLGQLLGDMPPEDVPGRRDWLLGHRVALWDVLSACQITGSSDASIQQAVPNDISRILQQADIRAIYCNGQTAARHYTAYAEAKGLMAAHTLPSTSPANAAWQMDRLLEAWRVIMSALAD